MRQELVSDVLLSITWRSESQNDCFKRIHKKYDENTSYGSCNIDYVYNVNNIVKPGETISSQSLNVFAGGKGLNQSLAIARSGATVYHAGCIGNDGLFLKEMLENSGVDTRYLQVGDTATGHAINLVLTLGKNGSIFANQYKKIKCKAYPTKTVDTTGAGDTFLGYFISGFSKTNDISNSLNLASMAAALAVTKNGAAESIPFENEVLSALNNVK